jgi:VCBS repeat-containing protein
MLGNDTDTDLADALTITGVNGAAATTTNGTYGSLVWNASTGAYTYTLNNTLPAIQALAVGQFLNEVFTYNITDGNGGTASSTVTIRINGTNDAPKANSDVNTITEGVVAVVETNGNGRLVLNDTDVDADPLTVTTINGSINKTAAGTYGTLTWIANGSYTYTLNVAATDSLKVGQQVLDVFNYTVSDGNGGTASSTLTVTITGINDAPTPIDDANSISEGGSPVSNTSTFTNNTSNTGALIANDGDLDKEVLTIVSINGSANKTTTGTYGTLVWNINGTYTYTLINANVDSLQQGEVVNDGFNYVETDGNVNATAKLVIKITGVNDAIVAVNDKNAISEGVASVTNTTSTTDGTGNILANDIDVDADTKSVKNISHGSTTTTNGTTVGKYGTLVWTTTGDYIYSLDNASVDSLALGEQVLDVFTYTATDGKGGDATATLTITITGTNDAPKAVNDIRSITEGTASVTNTLSTTNGTGKVLANDSDIDGDVLFVSKVNGSNATSTNGKYGTLVWNTDGAYTYNMIAASMDTLRQGEQTTDVFTYEATDSKGGTVTATLTITITGVNDAPVLTDDSNTISEGTASVSQSTGTGIGSILLNDTDGDAEILSVSKIGTSTNGTTVGKYGTLTWTTQGNYVYALNNNAVDSLQKGEQVVETFTYSATDGIATNQANLVITITGTNDNPLAVNDGNNMSESVDLVTNVSGTGTLLVNDTDIDDNDNLTVAKVSGSTTINISGKYGNLTWASNGTYTYDLNNTLPVVAGLAEAEVLLDSFKYEISDGQGGSAEAYLIVTITGGNSNPTAVPDVNEIFEDQISVLHTQGSGTLIVNDKDLDATDVLTVVTINTSANDTIDGVFGTLIWNIDGTYSYVLNNDNAVIQALAVGETQKV